MVNETFATELRITSFPELSITDIGKQGVSEDISVAYQKSRCFRRDLCCTTKSGRVGRDHCCTPTNQSCIRDN